MSDYIEKLRAFAQLKIPVLAVDFFTMALQTMSDCWRRFVFVTRSFPYVLLNNLHGLEYQEFLKEYGRLQQIALQCRECVDPEFTTVLLQYIPQNSLGQIDSPCVKAKVAHIQRFIHDIAVHTPLSSDIVECRHGFSQWLLHRWRGAKPSEPVAQERLFWSLVCTSYKKFKEWLWTRIGDAGAFHRQKRFGMPGRNQYSQAKAERQQHKQDRSLTFEKMDRLIAFGQTTGSGMTPRKLSGDLSNII